MQQLECPRDRSVVSNVAKEVMRNRQNRATGTSEITPKADARPYPPSLRCDTISVDLLAAMHESGFGPSRHFAAKQRFGRCRREADID